MTTYILLRKNKESGPLSFEQLKGIGLLPDDRIWVEGQSVFWLNPGEIIELKPLLGENTEASDLIPPASPLKKEKISAGSGKKQNGYLKPDRDAGTEEPGNDRHGEKKEDHGNGTIIEIWKNYLPGDKNQEIPGVAPVPGSVENLEPVPIFAVSARKKRLPEFPTKKIALYAVVLGAGLIAGLLIKGSGKKKKIVPLNSISSEMADQKSSADSTLTPPGSPAETVINNTDPLQKPEDKTNPPLVDPANEKPVTASLPSANEKSVVIADTLAAAAKKEEKKNAEMEKPVVTKPAADLSTLVRVKTNDYEVGSFGGIHNLELTLKNNSAYTLEKVTVELKYLKPRDEFLRAEQVTFSSVAPGATQILPVKKSNRGVKVVCRIISIESKDNGS